MGFFAKWPSNILPFSSVKTAPLPLQQPFLLGPVMDLAAGHQGDHNKTTSTCSWAMLTSSIVSLKARKGQDSLTNQPDFVQSSVSKTHVCVVFFTFSNMPASNFFCNASEISRKKWVKNTNIRPIVICHQAKKKDFPEIRGFPFLSYLLGVQVPTHGLVQDTQRANSLARSPICRADFRAS